MKFVTKKIEALKFLLLLNFLSTAVFLYFKKVWIQTEQLVSLLSIEHIAGGRWRVSPVWSLFFASVAWFLLGFACLGRLWFLARLAFTSYLYASFFWFTASFPTKLLLKNLNIYWFKIYTSQVLYKEIAKVHLLWNNWNG